jgi:hypothetical protein
MSDRTGSNGAFASSGIDWADARGSSSTVVACNGHGKERRRAMAAREQPRDAHLPSRMNFDTVAWNVAFWTALGGAAFVRVLGL